MLTPDYKILNLKQKIYNIPSEKFIKKIYEEFNVLLESKKVIIRGYQGTYIDSDSEDSVSFISLDSERNRKSKEFRQLKELDIYGSMDNEEIVDMNNGHVMIANTIKRSVVLQNDDNSVIGAISFDINLNHHQATVLAFAVQDKRQNQRLGSTLLQAAILISKLYGVNVINVEPTDVALPIYLKHGFYMENYVKPNEVASIFDLKEAQIFFENHNSNDPSLVLDFSNAKCNQLLTTTLPESLKNLTKAGFFETLPHANRHIESNVPTNLSAPSSSGMFSNFRRSSDGQDNSIIQQWLYLHQP